MKNPQRDPWKGLLDPGEKIIWQGRPSGRLAFRPSDLAISAFGIVFFAFSIFWVGMASSMGGGTGFGIGSIFPLFGIPFILVGFYMMIGRFFWDAWKRKKSTYSLSNRRAFIATDLFGKRALKSYNIDKDTELEIINEGREETIYFAEEWIRTRRSSQRVKIGFELIENARSVYEMLREIQRST